MYHNRAFGTTSSCWEAQGFAPTHEFYKILVELSLANVVTLEYLPRVPITNNEPRTNTMHHTHTIGGFKCTNRPMPSCSVRLPLWLFWKHLGPWHPTKFINLVSRLHLYTFAFTLEMFSTRMLVYLTLS